jgi:hypothetical protein
MVFANEGESVASKKKPARMPAFSSGSLRIGSFVLNAAVGAIGLVSE